MDFVERCYVKHQIIFAVNKTTSKENCNFKSGATPLFRSLVTTYVLMCVCNTQCSPQNLQQKGGVSNHIKALKLQLLQDQRDYSLIKTPYTGENTVCVCACHQLSLVRRQRNAWVQLRLHTASSRYIRRHKSVTLSKQGSNV